MSTPSKLADTTHLLQHIRLLRATGHPIGARWPRGEPDAVADFFMKHGLPLRVHCLGLTRQDDPGAYDANEATLRAWVQGHASAPDASDDVVEVVAELVPPEPVVAPTPTASPTTSPTPTVSPAPTPALPEAPAAAALPLNELQGVGPTYARRLQDAGVQTLGELARRCPDEASARALAETANVPRTSAVRWASQARLRVAVSALSAYDAELLVLAEVFSPAQLAGADATALRARLLPLAAERGYSALPDDLTPWIQAAQASLSR